MALHQHHAGQQHPGRADQPAAGLQHQRHAQVAQHRAHHPGESRNRRARLVAIADAQPAAAIQPGHLQPPRAQGMHQLGGAGIGGAIGGDREDLAADMQRQPHRPDARQAGGAGVQLHRLGIGDAELVLGAPGGDLGVGAGIHVRIDAQRHAGDAPHAGGDGREHLQLLGALHVDLGDVLGQRQPQFAHGLADAGEHDVFGRDACVAGAAQFALADHVRPGAAGGEQAQHGQVVVGLHRVMDLRIHAVQGGLQLGQPGAHGAGGIDPGGGAQHPGDTGERHAFQQQPVMGVHGKLRAGGDQRGDGRVGRVGCGCGSGHVRTLGHFPHR